MPSLVEPLPRSLGIFSLTQHARTRSATRAVSRAAIEAALEFGRVVSIRGAQIFAIGRKEAERFGRVGIDLTPFEGIQVVVTDAGAVLTVYRNKDFRGLRTRGHRRRSA